MSLYEYNEFESNNNVNDPPVHTYDPPAMNSTGQNNPTTSPYNSYQNEMNNQNKQDNSSEKPKP